MSRKRQATNILNRQLGQLELMVLEILWQQPGLDAKAILAQLNQPGSAMRTGSLSTVQSTLERLVKKELLSRTKSGLAYQYHPTANRSHLLARMMGEVIQLLHDGRLETILSSFINVAAQLDKDSLERLEKMIAAKKAAEGSNDGNL
ncbi:MAG: BlaI/MecI/CopY family transcriptional regulator [Pseudohongiellaceae bacterium]